MKKTAIITFHAAHNYGSVLQAYALQSVVRSMGMECQIINFRTDRQRELYAVLTKRKGLRYFFKNICRFLYYKAFCRKYQNFEAFIQKFLVLTNQEYLSLEELDAANFDFDFYISGSDQIWNPMAYDFDWAFYLPFVKSGKRIAYAPSFGPLACMRDEETKCKIAEYLQNYDAISVREKRSFDNVRSLIGTDVEITLDPTLLLCRDDWDKVMADKPLVEGEYIFLYTLFATREIINIAKYFSKELNLPVVISTFTNQYDVITPFKKCFTSGPADFLRLIKDARLVLTSSFHGTVFSLMYQKPFYSIGGAGDARISNLLNIAGLAERCMDSDNFREKLELVYNIDFDKVQEKLQVEAESSKKYLRRALCVDANM